MPSRLAAISIALVTALVATRSWADGKPDEPAPPPPGVLVRLDSTRVETLLERRANRIEGFTISVPLGYVLLRCIFTSMPARRPRTTRASRSWWSVCSR